MLNEWYKNNDTDRIWWKDTSNQIGVFLFSFDKKKEYNLFADYPYKLTPKEKKIFDEENPTWVEFFSDRQ